MIEFYKAYNAKSAQQKPRERWHSQLMALPESSKNRY